MIKIYRNCYFFKIYLEIQVCMGLECSAHGVLRPRCEPRSGAAAARDRDLRSWVCGVLGFVATSEAPGGWFALTRLRHYAEEV